MPLSELSSTVQDYLKVIWSATEWAPGPVTVTRLAERMGVRKATVSDAVRRLVDAGLLAHEPYGGVELTELGRGHALGMVRRHRLIETFLVDMLGYGWDEVHDEAENLEHAVSDTLVDRIDALLGHPTRDPHGDPIPTRDGLPHLPDAILLADAPAGVPLTVERISDSDPALLRALASRGIRPGTVLIKPADFTAEEAAAIWVSAAPAVE
ncbi:metal-dependent transcriptional regulator [Gryllotalpicola kribbensis]|uniref:Manganese transport regulator n=1 Tax=Gryllotalpicola kribbensis TaxID=993084 RepID=A0ABP8B0X8_9MICO